MSKPVAVLTSLEDSPPLLDRRLVAAYLRTVYRIADPPFEVYIGKHNPALETWLSQREIYSFAFITAANPGSKLLPESENDRRNAALLELLAACTPAPPRPAIHESADSSWPVEKSWWVPGISASDAAELGRQFGQNAIVYWQLSGVTALWWL